jgi:hypothetical protein
LLTTHKEAGFAQREAAATAAEKTAAVKTLPDIANANTLVLRPGAIGKREGARIRMLTAETYNSCERM